MPVLPERSGGTARRKIITAENTAESLTVRGGGRRGVTDRAGVTVDKVKIALRRDITEQRRRSAVNSTVFQPICGTGRPSGVIFCTGVSIRPSRSIFPSSLVVPSNCIPRQIPSTGWVRGTDGAHQSALCQLFHRRTCRPYARQKHFIGLPDKVRVGGDQRLITQTLQPRSGRRRYWHSRYR